MFPIPKKIQVPVYIPVYHNELLKGRRALITGGTSGIGLSMAKAFLASGAEVIITGRNQQKLESALSCFSKSEKIQGIILDNASPDQFEKSIESNCERYGLPDILVNNAGIIGCNTFGSIELDNYNDIMNTNLRGTVFLSQVITNKWKKENIKGNVLNICSSSSLRPGNSPYVLSKWGLRALTLGMARELIPYGITVNGLAPGPTATKMFVGNGDNGINWPHNPIGRLGTEEEMANLAVILVSNLSRMIVGDVLYATGGSGTITFDDIK